MDSAQPTDSLPVGALYKEDNGAQAYLVPTDTANLYDFYYGTKPDNANVLSTQFAIVDLPCGGQCGGLQIVYDSTNSTGGNVWLAYPDATVTSGWRVSSFPSIQGWRAELIR